MRVLLETDRLVLREFTIEDLDQLVELDSDPEVMRYLSGGAPTPREKIQTEILPRFMRYRDDLPGRGFWAAIDKSTGEFVGWFAFHAPDDDRTDEAELGFRLKRTVWGRGYATEGSTALVGLGLGELSLRRIFAVTYEGNLASQRVLEKVGLHLVRRFRMSPDEIVAVGTFDSFADEPWDGDDLEYAIEIDEWRGSGGVDRPRHPG